MTGGRGVRTVRRMAAATPEHVLAAHAARGLTEAEAARRLAERGPVRPPATSRSYASIVRANVLTVFNAILAAFGALTLVFGDWRDALFLGILVANAGIGIAQEARAKRTLDRLALVVSPTAMVVRDGARRPLRAEQLVEGDLVHVQGGDQLVADARVPASAVAAGAGGQPPAARDGRARGRAGRGARLLAVAPPRRRP
jgi:magnesium-transporting ATPase (P-type)